MKKILLTLLILCLTGSLWGETPIPADIELFINGVGLMDYARQMPEGTSLNYIKALGIFTRVYNEYLDSKYAPASMYHAGLCLDSLLDLLTKRIKNEYSASRDYERKWKEYTEIIQIKELGYKLRWGYYPNEIRHDYSIYESLLEKYPKSIYADDCAYLLTIRPYGMDIESTEAAISVFKKRDLKDTVFINTYPNSKYVPAILLDMLNNYSIIMVNDSEGNLDNYYEEASRIYNNLNNNYPETPEAAKAVRTMHYIKKRYEKNTK